MWTNYVTNFVACTITICNSHNTRIINCNY
nr:MAG TPA: hypothetical protein [Caudoviricetes sp.]